MLNIYFLVYELLPDSVYTLNPNSTRIAYRKICIRVIVFLCL